MWINLLTQSFLSVHWFCIVNLSDGWDRPGIFLYEFTRYNLPISSNKRELLFLSTSCRVSRSQFSKTRLVKCNKSITSDFVCFEWTNGKNNVMNLANNRILRDIDWTYRRYRNFLFWFFYDSKVTFSIFCSTARHVNRP